MSINNAIEIIVNEGMKKSNKPPKKPRASKTKHVVKAVVTEKVKDACSDPNSPLDKQYLQHWKKQRTSLSFNELINIIGGIVTSVNLRIYQE